MDHLVGTAAGWGGLPEKAASYVLGSVGANDGDTPYRLTVEDVPVDAFWSVTVYNADGYLEANELGVNSYNDVTAETNDDGSYTLHFGGCEDGRVNCIPVTPGWNSTSCAAGSTSPSGRPVWRAPEPFPALETDGDAAAFFRARAPTRP